MFTDRSRWRRRPFRRLRAFLAAGFLALVLLVRPVGLLGQRLPERRFREAPLPAAAALPSPARAGVAGAPALGARANEGANGDVAVLGAGAVVGGIVGAGVGTLLGYYAGGGAKMCGDDACGLGGAILGFLIGEPTGVGLGAHLANRRGGKLLLDVLGAAATGYVFGAVAGTTGEPGWLGLVALVQVGATVAIERGTAEAKQR